MSLRSIEQLFLERPSNRFFVHNDHLPYRTLARKKKKVFYMNWEMKCNWGSMGPVNPSVDSAGE